MDSSIIISLVSVVIIIIVCVCLIIYCSTNNWLSKAFSPITDLGTDNGIGRGVGVPIHTCPTGEDQDSGLCYKKCTDVDTAKSDLQQNPNLRLKGVGPVCWPECPAGMTDIGVGCQKGESYGRGAGRVPDVSCPSGWTVRGVGTASWCSNNSNIFQTQQSSQTCHSDEELNGGLCYPKCRDGFHAVGCCICSPDCPAGFVDSGVTCTKKSYPRGVGVPMTCDSEEDYDVGLCYPKCKYVPKVQDAMKRLNKTFNGVGPICWQN